LAAFEGPSNQFVSFGSFRLFPAQHLLLEQDRPIRLGSRAFGILAALVERAGELVTKDELIARIWPDTTVEEQNLTVHIAGLRKVLGDGRDGHRYIVNIPGRGYRFVAPVSKNGIAADVTARSGAGRPAHNLPAPLTRMVGRDEDARAISDRLRHQRFVTLVGPGGMGKTTVAMAAAYEQVGFYKDGIWFVDFASVENPATVPHTAAFALGLPASSDLSVSELNEFLRDKDLLLFLDCCDRVVDAVAALAMQLLRSAPRLNILATSREPMHASGESVWRLGPLEVPRRTNALSASQALAFPAVQLFAQCAAASLDTFELTDFDAPIVADICRRLDGIPLAIELVAGHIGTLGVGGLAAALDKFPLLSRGKRAASSRHQTLHASLDWSHEILSAPERIVLRRLAIFDTYFTLEGAIAIAGDPTIATADVFEAIDSLVAKSLIAADISRETVYYRLLETTRSYMLEKLLEADEFAPIAERHAEHLRDVLRRAGLKPDGSPFLEG